MLCHGWLYRVLLWISSFMIIILYLFISCLSICILFHLSPALFWSYYESSLLDIICCISTCPCMLVPTIQFSMHVYDSDLSIHVCLSMLATWHSYHPLAGEFCLTPLDSHVQVSELGACGFSQLLIRVAQLKHGSLADRLKPHPSRPPCSALEFSCYDSEPPFVLFILVHPLYSDC